VIYHEGTTGHEMYIVITGELEITAGGTRLGFISDGGFFGELRARSHCR
jgi:CRP-like cAMP-binding protein